MHTTPVEQARYQLLYIVDIPQERFDLKPYEGKVILSNIRPESLEEVTNESIFDIQHLLF